MSLWTKLQKIARNILKSSSPDLPVVMVGCYNVMENLVGVDNMESLKRQRANQRPKRNVEYHVRWRPFQNKEYYFVGAIGHKVFGPEVLKTSPTKEELVDLARKYLILCPECNRWVERAYWDTARGTCKICVEEERIVALQTSELAGSLSSKPVLRELDEIPIEKKFPEKCPKCGYPIRESEVVWVGGEKFQCPSCQTEMRMESTGKSSVKT